MQLRRWVVSSALLAQSTINTPPVVTTTLPDEAPMRILPVRFRITVSDAVAKSTSRTT